MFLGLILSRRILDLLGLITLRGNLALYMLKSCVAISLPPLLMLLLFLLLLAALRRHHYLDLRVPVFLLNYLVDLSATHAWISVGARPPARSGQVHLSMLI